MPQLVPSFIARLLRAAAFNGQAGRCTARLPLSISLADARSAGGPQSFPGFTLDLSRTGLSFVTPSVFIGNCHIFCEGGAALRVRLELPEGPVEVKARPVRYDSAAEGGQGYVVGAHILEMSERDRDRYLRFLRARARGLAEPAPSKASNRTSAVSNAA